MRIYDTRVDLCVRECSTQWHVTASLHAPLLVKELLSTWCEADLACTVVFLLLLLLLPLLCPIVHSMRQVKACSQLQEAHRLSSSRCSRR